VGTNNPAQKAPTDGRSATASRTPRAGKGFLEEGKKEDLRVTQEKRHAPGKIFKKVRGKVIVSGERMSRERRCGNPLSFTEQRSGWPKGDPKTRKG